MLSYLARRGMVAVLVLWIIATLTFLLMHNLPGGPFRGEKRLPPAIERNIMERYRLKEPIYQQYKAFLTNIIRGDLGPSFRYQGRSVNQLLGKAFPVSATVGILALSLALGVGIPLGIEGAVREGSPADRLIFLLTGLGMGVPTFVLAPVLLYIFAHKLGWLPPALWGGPAHLVLPVVSLALFPTALVTKLVQRSMEGVLSEDYLHLARAKGLSEGMVLYRHALPNALVPVLAYMGPLVVGILTGSFVVEGIFALPGLGEYFVTSIYNRDYGIIMGIALFYSALLVAINLIFDLALAGLDPRFALWGRGGEG